jgi:hypothetical protein
MGIYTYSGRNLRGLRLIRPADFWIILGRPDYPTLSFPWPNEGIPPPEDPDVLFPDAELGEGIYGIGYKQAEQFHLVSLDPEGSIYFKGDRWSFASSDPDDENYDPEARHVYIRASVAAEDFREMEVDNGYASLDDLLGFRRVTIVGSVVAPPTADAPSETGCSFRYSDFLTTEWQRNAPYALYQLVTPTIENGHIYAVTQAGTTGVDEPSWPTGQGTQCRSGNVIFKEHSAKTAVTDRRGQVLFTHNMQYLLRPTEHERRILIEFILLT